MNLRFRINQLKNSLFPPKKKKYRWIFVYGIPRSGTTYFYQELMQIARLGVSDFDLGKFVPVIEHIDQSGYIPLDTQALKNHLRDQLLMHAAPGGGSKYDFIIKQVNTNLTEYQLLCELMSSEPSEKYFLYREPNGWLPSAMKKFGIDEKMAEGLYKQSFDSFSIIGGEQIEYGSEITSSLALRNIRPLNAFGEKTPDSTLETNSQLRRIYSNTKKT